MESLVRRSAILFVAACPWLGSGCSTGQEEPISLEQEIQAALVNRVDDAQNTIGIVVGILTPDGQSFLHYGYADRENGIEPGPDTLFRIAGLTSVFSSLLLADMAVQGELKLDDPISAFLPASVDAPTFEGQEITLADLATGTSGLPPIPETYRGPPAWMQLQDLYDGLSNVSLARAPGHEMARSAFEEALLVDLLSRRAEVDYAELLRTRIFDKLGMTSTVYVPSEEQSGRVAATYNRDLHLRPPASLGALDMGIGLYSTAEDLLNFAAAFLATSDRSLEAAMREMLSVSLPVTGHRSASSTHLGWLGIDGAVYFRSVGAYNSSASLAIDPERQRAVVVLVNNPVDMNVIESISLHALIPEHPLLMYPPKQALAEVTIPPDRLDAYIGEYRVDPEDSGLTYTMLASVRREADRLVLVRSRLVDVIQGPVPINEFDLGALSETEFFARGNENWTFSFQVDDSGKVTGLTILRPPGNPLSLQKSDEEP